MTTRTRTRAAALAATAAAALAALIPCPAAFAQGRVPSDQTPPTAAAPLLPKRFDFGTATRAPGYVLVGPDAAYGAERGYGWLSEEVPSPADLLARDRGGPDDLRGDFVFGRRPRTFRIDAPPGRYRLTVIAGDADFGDHALDVSVPGVSAPLPVLRPAAGEFVTLEVEVRVSDVTPLDVTFRSPDDNWVVNAVTLAPVASGGGGTPPPPRVTRQTFARAVPPGTWGPVASWPDPTADYLRRHRRNAATPPPSFRPTGLRRADYLKLIAGGVDFWKAKQNPDTGAIVDPYRNVEFQYSTPAFAHAAATLVVYAGRKDLLEAAAKALDWSARTLSERKAASGHEDFFAPMVAHTLRLLKGRVPARRSARWEADVRRFDPFATYRFRPGANNWNVVAMSGEYLFQKAGLRPPTDTFVRASMAAQGRHFGSPYGLYLEGPMAYDHFPRLWAADMLASGYAGPYAAPMAEVLRRGAVTSLFLQSPWGELPAGGRSAHHQWNEAEQCVTFEIYAARALKNGDKALAGYYKRAARLALNSMRRWRRPTGELQIVKNWVDPAKGHGFESYSAHSQYGLLPLSMLAIAYEHAGATEKIAEKPAPADVGGYVLVIDQLHKVVANAGGTYVEVDTAADRHYDATGLIRVHSAGVSPQLGPSDSLLAGPSYGRPEGDPRPPTTGVGVAWRLADGTWRHLGERGEGGKPGTVGDVVQTAGRVLFTVRYEDVGPAGSPAFVEERYAVGAAGVELTTRLGGYDGPLRYAWPVLADDGRTRTEITVRDGTVSVTGDRGRTARTFRPVGAASVTVGAERYPNHNGWARLAVAEYPAGTATATLVIAARR